MTAEAEEELKQFALQVGDMVVMMEPMAKALHEAGLEDVQFDSLGSYGYRFRARNVRNESCRTPQGVESTVMQVLTTLGFKVEDGIIVAVVVEDQVGATFRLQPVIYSGDNQAKDSNPGANNKEEELQG